MTGGPAHRPLRSTRRVSVLIPVLDEEASITRCLDLLDSQTRPPDEIVVADGGSTDRTRDLVEAHSGNLRLVDNPRRLQGAGLNIALGAATGQVIVRLDARSFVPHDYIERLLDLFEETGAAVVGGRMVPQPQDGLIAAGVAAANTARWGAGPARFHGKGAAGPAETVYLGAFQRNWLERAGGWAEDVGVNEDYELNHRIRRDGGVVWLEPSIEVGYQPRSTLRALVKQYFRYGRSKAAVMQRHPSSIRPRQLAPLALPLAAMASMLDQRGLRVAGRAAITSHVALVLTGAATLRDRPAAVRLIAAVSALVMHWSWAAGVVYGLLRPFPAATSRP